MKKFIFILFFFPLFYFGINVPIVESAILETGVGSNSVWVKTGASAGAGGDYIDAPIPFNDDDYKWACWYVTGSSSECTGFHSHDIGSTPADGDYIFTDTTTDPDTTFTLSICSGVWQLTSCSSPTPTPTSSTTVTIILNPVQAIFYPAFFFLAVFGIIIFYYKRK